MLDPLRSHSLIGWLGNSGLMHALSSCTYQGVFGRTVVLFGVLYTRTGADLGICEFARIAQRAVGNLVEPISSQRGGNGARKEGLETSSMSTTRRGFRCSSTSVPSNTTPTHAEWSTSKSKASRMIAEIKI